MLVASEAAALSSMPSRNRHGQEVPGHGKTREDL
jgi:hypothetical protein